MQAPRVVTSQSPARSIALASLPVLATSRRKGTAHTVATSMLCAALMGCCGPNDPSCRNVRLGPSGAEVAGVAIGVGAVIATVVAVEVHHAHHTLDGCVSSGPGGMQIQTQRATKTYMLSGQMTNIAAGQRVRLHGTRVKQPKHSTAAPIFTVESTSKVYGPCKLSQGSSTPAP